MNFHKDWHNDHGEHLGVKVHLSKAHWAHVAVHDAYSHPTVKGEAGNQAQLSLHPLSITDNNAPVNGDHPLTGTNDARIEHNNSGESSVPRDKKDVNDLVVRHDHKQGDPSPNYVIDQKGHIVERRSPGVGVDSKDHQVIIELEGSQLSSAQSDSLKQLSQTLIHEYPQLTPNKDNPPDAQPIIEPPVPTAPQSPAGVSDGSGTGSPSPVRAGRGSGNFSGHPSSNGGGASDVSSPNGADGGRSAGGGGGGGAVDLSGIVPELGNDPIGITARMIIQHESGGKPVQAVIDSDNVPSVGLFQANQKGELPALLATFAQDPQNYALLVKIFGPEIAARMKNGDLNFNMNGMLNQLKELSGDANFIKTEQQFLKKTIADVAGQVGRPPYNVTSAEGVAMLVDAYQQYGPGGFKQFLNKAVDQPTQQGKVDAIKAALEAGKYGDHYRKDIATIEANGLDANKNFS